MIGLKVQNSQNPNVNSDLKLTSLYIKNIVLQKRCTETEHFSVCKRNVNKSFVLPVMMGTVSIPVLDTEIPSGNASSCLSGRRHVNDATRHPVLEV